MTNEPVPLHVPAESAGALPYGLGFLAYIPAPFANLIITGIVMAAVYPSQKRKGTLAAENARQAANWGLTMIAVMIVMFALILVIVPFVNHTSASSAALAPLILFGATAVAHLIVIITGLVHANRREVFRNPIAIPFFRAVKV